MDYGDDGFLLNVHTLEPSHSRKLSGKSNKVRSWSGKKAAQKQKVQFRNVRRQYHASVAAPSAILPSDKQLKGYSIDPPFTAPSAADPSPRTKVWDHPRRGHASVEDVDIRQGSPPLAANPTKSGPNGSQPPPTIPRLKRGQEQHNEGRIGRMRVLSRQAGDREATPDQDDIQAGSDDESDDLLATVTAAVQRDKLVEEELAAQRKLEEGSVDDMSDDSKGERRDEDLEVWKEGVVGFDESGERYPVVRTRKEKNRERKKNDRSGTVAVRPGELTHTQRRVTQIESQGGSEVFLTANDGTHTSVLEPTFTGVGLSKDLVLHLKSIGFEAPTKVQLEVIPLLLNHRDVLVNAPTGSGKTLCYLAPIIQHLSGLSPRLSRSDGTVALVIVPTRELSLQVVDAATLLARRFAWIVPGSVHGGENRSKEKARLRKGVTLLVATPGRLLDHLENTASFKTGLLRWLVLDEADRLLDLGFEKKLSQILGLLESSQEARMEGIHALQGLPSKRQSVLLSATLPSELGGLVKLSLREPASVGFSPSLPNMKGTQGVLGIQRDSNNDPTLTTSTASPDKFIIPKQLKQRFVDVPCKLRLVALAALLKVRIAAAPQKAKLAVFFSSCDSVEFHHAVLQEAWPRATGSPLLPRSSPLLKLHGNMPQGDRTAALLQFNKAGAGVLLCTDVAARGLDFPAVSGIFQFDPPGSSEEYVHRVGRTARLGAQGEAVLFVMPSERGFVEHLRSHGVGLQEESTTAALDSALGMDARAGKNLPLERHHGGFQLQRQMMDVVGGSQDLTHKAELAFRSFVRAYATHSMDLKPFFSIKTLHLGHAAHSFALK